MTAPARMCMYAPRMPGILLAVGALEAAGLLAQLATMLGEAVPDPGIVAGAIGVVSSLVDNVPLVAATMGMYDLASVPTDSQQWQMIALCAGEQSRRHAVARGCWLDQALPWHADGVAIA